MSPAFPSLKLGQVVHHPDLGDGVVIGVESSAFSFVPTVKEPCLTLL